MKILGIIPARYASTRFPAKALHDIEGKSMVQRVYEQSIKAKSLSKVIVATDHQRIFDHIKEVGGDVVMTSDQHPSGTDRCYEALQQMEDFDYVINIQGDEPFIQPAQIDTLANVLKDTSVELATLMKKITNPAEITDPNEVKITFNTNSEALYFSRQPIPFVQGVSQSDWHQNTDFFKHVGMYAYRSDVLKAISLLPPSPLEMIESLEQLRWLENGFKIKLATTELESFCVDVIEDLENIDIKALIKD